jgi:phenylpropionate dioxygenase-like ring-hydroxylating dioxygenase large terminal subunit
MHIPVTGQLSAPGLLKQWYVACEAQDLEWSKPLAVKIFDTAMVLFRDEKGKPCAMPDRCPHRNVPLSEGNVIDGELVCIYHGWQFNGQGERTKVPGLLEQDTHKCSIPTFSCMEQDGFIWVCPSPDHEPLTEPLPLPKVGKGYASYRFVFDLDCTVHAALENALDVAHTSFLHGGLFRGVQERNPIDVELKPVARGFEAEYIGEPLLPGGRKPPRGVKPQHWDRFFLPSTVQIEYSAGANNHVLNTMYHTPVSAVKTRLYFVGYMRLPGLGRFFKPLIAHSVKKILQQDIDMLAKQTENILRFDGEHYKSSQMDLFGPQVLRFMRHAESFEKGEVDTPVPEYQPRQFRITL